MKFTIVLVALFGVAMVAAAPAAPGAADAVAETLRLESDVSPEGFVYSYETSNGISSQASGQLKTIEKEEAVVAQGSYSWTDPEGHTHSITYVADENGFQPQGADIPVAPQV